MIKPPFLYHASARKDLQVLNPRQKTIRNKDEGPVVFATTSPQKASVFIVDSDDSWSQKSAFGNEQYSIYADRARFEKSDKGGAIYTLPTDTFTLDRTFGGGKYEWTSNVSVKPVSQTNYKTGLEAMLSLGVKVYFVDDKTLQKIQKANDHGFEIIQTLSF